MGSYTCSASNGINNLIDSPEQDSAELFVQGKALVHIYLTLFEHNFLFLKMIVRICLMQIDVNSHKILPKKIIKICKNFVI